MNVDRGKLKTCLLGCLEPQACMELSKETMSMKMTSLTKNMGEKKTGTLMTKSVHRPNKQFSPLKKYVYIYFAFLEIRIEVHFTLMKINAEGRYGMHGHQKTENPLE